MLDVSVRVGILNLLDDLRRDSRIGLLLITHDLASARLLDRPRPGHVRGRHRRVRADQELIATPKHPYTPAAGQLGAAPVRRPPGGGGPAGRAGRGAGWLPVHGALPVPDDGLRDHDAGRHAARPRPLCPLPPARPRRGGQPGSIMIGGNHNVSAPQRMFGRFADAAPVGDVIPFFDDGAYHLFCLTPPDGSMYFPERLRVSLAAPALG